MSLFAGTATHKTAPATLLQPPFSPRGLTRLGNLRWCQQHRTNSHAILSFALHGHATDDTATESDAASTLPDHPTQAIPPKNPTQHILLPYESDSPG